MKAHHSIRALALASAAWTGAMAFPAFAQDASAPAADTEEAGIIVTARRREETLVSVPIAVSAFSGADLERGGAIDISDLANVTPNTTLEASRGTNSTLTAFIRGVGQQDPVSGFEQGVGIYLDDVYLNRPQGALLDIYDVERIEVLRGPQGTLYGRNTIGGAIKYVTKRLGNDYAATARASYGSYNQFDLVGQVTVPIGDTFAIGGAIARYKRDGYGTNLTTGADQYDKDVLAARVSAEWTPTDAIFVRVAGDRTLDRSNPRHGTRLVGNGNDPRYAPTGNVYDTRAGIGDRNRVVAQGLSLTGEFSLSDLLTFKSISAYREGATNTVIDFDNTALPTLDVPAEYDDNQFTQELQLLLQGDRVQGVVGLYYLNATASGAFDTVVGGLNLTTLTSGEVKTKSYAAFGDISFDVTDRLKISGGLRYTKDDKTGTVFRRNYAGIRSPRFGNANAVPGLIRTDYTNDRSFDQFTPRVSISYEPRRDLNLYASWGRGFKSGGFDMRGDAVFTPTTVNGYDPEKITSYEVGMKGAFLDRTLFLNMAGYYSRYTDQQVTIQVPNIAGGIASFVDNAGKADIYGLEIEGRMVPSRNFSAQVSFGYTNADYKEFLTFIGGGTTPVDVSNQRVFQNTPEFTAAASFTASTDFAGGSLSVTPEVTLRSDYALFEIPTPALDQDGYALVNAAANWISGDGRYRLGMALRNLTDQRYRVGGYNFPGAVFGNSIIGYYGPPRTATATFEVKF